MQVTNWTWALNITNLTDKRYYEGCSLTNCSAGYDRSVIASLRYRWLVAGDLKLIVSSGLKTGGTQQGLVALTGLHPRHQAGDRLRLIAGRLETGHQLKFGHD